MPSKSEVVTYLKGRKKCDGRCAYHGFCPEYPPLINGTKDPVCMVYTSGNIDTFYNVFFGSGDGMKNELQRTLYKMQEESDPEEYLSACLKTYSTIYKDVADSKPPEIKINITPVDKE